MKKGGAGVPLRGGGSRQAWFREGAVAHVAGTMVPGSGQRREGAWAVACREAWTPSKASRESFEEF